MDTGCLCCEEVYNIVLESPVCVTAAGVPGRPSEGIVSTGFRIVILY